MTILGWLILGISCMLIIIPKLAIFIAPPASKTQKHFSAISPLLIGMIFILIPKAALINSTSEDSFILAMKLK